MNKRDRDGLENLSTRSKAVPTKSGETLSGKASAISLLSKVSTEELSSERSNLDTQKYKNYLTGVNVFDFMRV